MMMHPRMVVMVAMTVMMMGKRRSVVVKVLVVAVPNQPLVCAVLVGVAQLRPHVAESDRKQGRFLPLMNDYVLNDGYVH